MMHLYFVDFINLQPLRCINVLGRVSQLSSFLCMLWLGTSLNFVNSCLGGTESGPSVEFGFTERNKNEKKK